MPFIRFPIVSELDLSSFCISNASLVHEEGHSFTNISTDGKFMALTASTDGVVRVWDERNPQMAMAAVVAHESATNSALYLSKTDPFTIVTVGDDRACRVRLALLAQREREKLISTGLGYAEL